MSWLQFHIPTHKDTAAAIEEAANEAGAVAVTLTDGADEPLFEPPPGSTPLWQDTVVTALFSEEQTESDVITQLRKSSGLPLATYHAECLEDQTWERAWMDDFKPLCFGDRLWVVPSNHTPPDTNAVNLLLDPGLAFGTGTHATTAMCLQWLDQAQLDSKTLLDFGCGSGILAIAGLLCGAKKAHGCDIDPQAITASQDNAEHNQVADKLSLSLANAMPDMQADVVLANILAAPLIELAGTLAGYAKPQSDLVLSGILAEQAADVSAAYAPWFEMNAPIQKGDWVCLTGKRK